jgi:hypothetical protein
MRYLSEGGNVFKDKQGQPLTQRINQADVPGTVQWLEALTGINFSAEIDSLTNTPGRWLGSTGKKPTSGDLDLAVDSNEVTKEQLANLLTQYVTSQGLDPREWVKKAGEVHFRTPVNGDPNQGYVQTDFMFFPNVEWGIFYYGGGANSAFKGMNRNVLMSSIAKQLGLKVGANGVISRATNEVVSVDPDQTAKWLLGGRADRSNLQNVESIYAALANDPDRDAKLADFREYLKREGLQEPQTGMAESDANFLARLRDRIVNRGYVALVEAEQAGVGGRAKGIEHLEDLVFRRGTQGIKDALAIVQHSTQQPSTVTAKWDGKPAVIFGRKPATGEFVLTDGSGFEAKGYDGLATNPQQIARIMNMRGGERGELVALYQRLFPLLRRAVPQDFRGYIQGDLLYSETPELVDNAYVFTPNTVKYSVPADTDLGQKIAQSTAAVAIHTALAAPGAAPTPIRAAALESSPGLLILDPSLKEPREIKLNDKSVRDANSLLTQYGSAMYRLFNPAELRARKISDFPALIKTYINSRVRSGSYDNLIGGFGDWIKQKAPAKAPRIFEWATENKQAVAALFQAFLEISNLKNQVVRQLDAQAHDVRAIINNEPGHEGYVGNGMKFVDRMRFSAANFAKNNPELG